MTTIVRHITVEREGACARVVFNRPPLNIFTTEMLQELNHALHELQGERRLKVLVIAAEGKAFSAGVAVEDHLPEKADAMIKTFHATFRILRGFDCPVISAVQGAALGGGCELACFADLVIASGHATFGQPEVKLGVFPPIAAVHFPRRIGLARTLQLLLSGEIISAQEADRIGLVDRVVAPAELPDAVDKEVARFSEMSGSALRLTKRAVLSAYGRDFEGGLGEVERVFAELMQSRDPLEGLRAFLEKRKPVWSDTDDPGARA